MRFKAKENTKNLILDLGGVIIPINPELSFASIATKSGWDLQTVKSFFKQNAIFKTYENGDLSTDEFLKMIEHHLLLSKSDIIDSWNQLLLEIPEKRIQLLKELKRHFNLILLSNTNELHIRAINQQLISRGFRTLDELFHKVYFSYEIKLSKPSTEIYHHVLKELELNPAETVFIDDLKENADGATSTGIFGFHLELPNYQLENLFTNE